MSALPPKSPATVAPFSDALGYRVLGFDKKSGDRLEMLRLRPQLASSPAFEAAVRERQRRLADFRHAAYARVRQIDRPAGQNAALAVVSNYADGQRLSELLRSAQNNAVPIELIVGMCLLQQMVAAVAQLHAIGADLSHGALNPERIVVTPAGRIVVTEYVAGAGLGSLGLTPQQAWQDYRLALPSDGGEAFTQASDVYQLGYLGLTLVSGRSIYDRQYPPPFATLLNGVEEIGTDGRTQPLHPAIVSWLTRALRLGGPFASAIDAQASLDAAIASAGLVATPDVVADFVARAAGETEGEPATMISMPAPQAAAPPVPAPVEAPLSAPASDLPVARAAVETPWTPPATVDMPAPIARRDSGPHQSYVPPAVEAATAELPAAVAEAAPADLDLPMHDEAPAPSDSELPPAQAWTPKKRDISREVKVAKPAAISHALLGHDDSHSHASDVGQRRQVEAADHRRRDRGGRRDRRDRRLRGQAVRRQRRRGHAADDRRGGCHRHAVHRLDAAGPRVHRRGAEGHHAAAARHAGRRPPRPRRSGRRPDQDHRGQRRRRQGNRAARRADQGLGSRGRPRRRRGGERGRRSRAAHAGLHDRRRAGRPPDRRGRARARRRRRRARWRSIPAAT